MDLDRYYTPDRTANEVVEVLAAPAGTPCADTSCGEGRLLRAAGRVTGNALRIGIDSDRVAIRTLRRAFPDYIVSHGNFLSPKSRARMRATRYLASVKALYLNPPFSMEQRKGVSLHASFGGYRCSVAMAHIITAMKLVRPALGASAIVPESLVYSEMDGRARNDLASEYRLSVARELINSTFSGARANACILRLSPLNGGSSLAEKCEQEERDFSVRVVRGGLPVFEARSWKRGAPYVHSTDLSSILRQSTNDLRRVRPIRRGVVRGPVVLLPRVGAPRIANVGPANLREEVQLSDCVIALCCRTMREAKQLAVTIRDQWPSFVSLYRGTGARYITMNRLRQWLGDPGRTTRRVEGGGGV